MNYYYHLWRVADDLIQKLYPLVSSNVFLCVKLEFLHWEISQVFDPDLLKFNHLVVDKKEASQPGAFLQNGATVQKPALPPQLEPLRR